MYFYILCFRGAYIVCLIIQIRRYYYNVVFTLLCTLFDQYKHQVIQFYV